MKNKSILFRGLLLLFVISIVSCDDDDDGGSTSTVALQADFSTSALYIEQGDVVSFTDASLGSPSTYLWTFEGGSPLSSTEKNPTVTYNTAGVFKVNLLINRLSDGATNSKEVEITVYPSEDLVAYYPFDGDAEDKSGNGNSGTVRGASLTVDRVGQANEAFSFDGVDDLINTNTRIDDHLSEGATFSAWIKAETEGVGMRFIANYNGQGNGGDCSERRGFNLAMNTENRFTVQYLTDGNDYVGRKSEINTLRMGNWYHVAATWNGEISSKGFKLYINGVRVDVDNVETGNINCGGYLESTFPFQFGMGQCADSECAAWKGQIDEVRIYSSPLTSEEIAVLAIK